MSDSFTISSDVLYPVDTTPPVVTCPADIIQTVELGTTSVVVTFPNATATFKHIFFSLNPVDHLLLFEITPRALNLF